ncbi:hypothetical protein [Variovorax sp. GT1P44]|uniref:hypothetical protein n=1 Tax=Variovorax sp. GT1P44 TaxID=3443742 RepID=UPI003F45CAF6
MAIFRNSADRVADCVFVVLGYETLVRESVVHAELEAALRASGAAEGALSGSLHALAFGNGRGRRRHESVLKNSRISAIICTP